MTYYVAPDGRDDNSGTEPTRPVRSITRAIELILELPGEPMETIEVAAGTYANEHGEIFPLIVPHNVEIRGAGRDSTVLEYDEVSEVDVYVDLHGALYDLAIRDRAIDACVYLDLRSTDPLGIVQRVVANRVYFEWARHVSDVESDDWLGIGEGFESGGELYPLVENCRGVSFVVQGGRIENCLADIFWIASPGYTIIQDNQFGNRLGVGDAFIVVRSREEQPEEDEHIPQIINNSIGADLEYVGDVAGWSAFPTIWICGESEWRNNTIQAKTFVIASNATFEDNPLIAAGQFDIRRAGSYGVLPDTTDPLREISPTFRNNTFRQIGFHIINNSCSWLTEEEAGLWLPPNLFWIGDDARPVFEGNEINTLVGTAYVEAQAVPVFGDGDGLSAGGNIFQRQDDGPCPLFYRDFIVDIGEGHSLNLNARNNTWWRDTIQVEIRSGTVICNTDPNPCRVLTDET